MCVKMLRCANILLKLVNTSEILGFDTGETEIKYDYFDYVISCGKVSNVKTYLINDTVDKKCQDKIGYVVLYDTNVSNHAINIYAKIKSKRYYGELIKAFFALLEYVYSELHLKKVNLLYRFDNYFFDDVCKDLGFVREGKLRGQLICNGRLVDVNAYGMLDYEYIRLSNSVYKRMFSWDYTFSPSNIVQLDLTAKFNCRLFTNSIKNPNGAKINDWPGEFVMNQSDSCKSFLTYSNLQIPVKIFDFDYEYDCFSCKKQHFFLPKGEYTDLLLVTTAQFGNKQTYITAVYEDGSIEESTFTVCDWCGKIVRDEFVIHHAIACRKLDRYTSMIKCDAFLYLQRVHINQNKTLCEIVFPINNDIFIFAAGLCPKN